MALIIRIDFFTPCSRINSQELILVFFFITMSITWVVIRAANAGILKQGMEGGKHTVCEVQCFDKIFKKCIV